MEKGADPDGDKNQDEPVIIDESLRVYGGVFLPPDVAGDPEGAFFLAGNGLFRAVTPSGKLLYAQTFGSSASHVDYCPILRRVLVSSYSGIVHLYDPTQPASEGEAIGYNSRKEIARWMFWPTLPFQPVRW
jgi:hypothetical protein